MIITERNVKDRIWTPQILNKGSNCFWKIYKNRHQIAMKLSRPLYYKQKALCGLNLEGVYWPPLPLGRFAKGEQINSALLLKSILYSYNLDHITAIKYDRDNEPKALTQLSVQENYNYRNVIFLYRRGILLFRCNPGWIMQWSISGSEMSELTFRNRSWYRYTCKKT